MIKNITQIKQNEKMKMKMDYFTQEKKNNRMNIYKDNYIKQ